MKLDYEKISRIVLFTLRLQEGTPSTPVSRIKVKIYLKIMNLLKGEQMKSLDKNKSTEGKKDYLLNIKI